MTLPISGTAYTFDVVLTKSNAAITNPTLAAGDVTISVDGGTFSNLDTLPVVTPSGSVNVAVTLSATEHTGSRWLVGFKDVTGDEWDEAYFSGDIPATNIESTPDVNVAQISTSSVAADQLEQNLLNDITGIASGTPTVTSMATDVSFTANNQFVGRIITFDDDTTTVALRKQSTDITGGVATSGTLKYTALTNAPVAFDSFVIT